MFKNIPAADFSAFGAPVQKLIELNTATFTKAFEAQKAAIEKQIAQAQADFQAFSSISFMFSGVASAALPCGSR